MYLVILTQYYPPETGAPQARLSALAAHFSKKGHRVSVLTAMPNYPKGKVFKGYGGVMQQEFQEGVHIIRTFIFPTKKADLIHRLANYFSFSFSSLLVGTMALKKADYLLVESPPLFLGLTGWLLSRFKRARLIFNVSDLWPESAVRLGMVNPEGMAYWISLRIEEFCYRKAWLITGQSNGILKDIQDRFPDYSTFHLSNGVDTQVFHPNSQTNDGSRTFWKKKDFIVLYAGLHGLAQGLEQALGAAVLLRTEDDVKLVLVGDGPKKEALIEKAQQDNLSNVIFLDSRPSQEIPALLAAADIVLVMLKMYIPGAVPSKLYEAMASGRPVVLVASGEAADIVREHQAGFVVEPGDIGGLAEAIRVLHASPDLRKSLGENGRQVAEKKFDRATIMAGFINYLGTNS